MSISSDSDSDWGGSPPAKRSKLASKGQSARAAAQARSSTPGHPPLNSARTGQGRARSRPTPRPKLESHPDSDEDFQGAVQPPQKPPPAPRLSREERQFQKQLAWALQVSTVEHHQPRGPDLTASPPDPEEEDSTAPLSCSLSPLVPEPPRPTEAEEAPATPTRRGSAGPGANHEPFQVQPTLPTPSPAGSESSGVEAPTRPRQVSPVRPGRESKRPTARPSGSRGSLTHVVPPPASSSVGNSPPTRPSPTVVPWKPPRWREGRGGPRAASPPSQISPGGSTFRPRVGLSRNIRGIKPLHAKVAWNQS